MGRAARGTHTDYRRPHRPLVVRAINRAAPLVGLADSARPLEADDLLAQASRREGLTDFGDASFRPGLSKLLEAIDEEARLTPVGRWITRQRLVGTLRNRLRAERWFKDHPEILDLEIDPPIVITGMQRTGTTLLHRLLASDPDNRALLAWEALNPAPFGNGKPPRGEPRIRTALASQRALALMAPDFFAVHPVEALAPEEDVLLLDCSFLSTVPEATLRVPGFSRWLEGQDALPAYAYMKRLLQLLQWQRPGVRWILKTPHHLEYLDALFAVFPNAKIVLTHRDPSITVGSFCSMVAHGRGVFSDSVDPEEIGPDWMAKVSRQVKRATDTRDRRGDGCFLDVYYRDLVQDPLAQVERIYEFVGAPFAPATRALVERTRDRNGRHAYGVHVYRLEDFGLTREMIAAEFAEYRRRYRVSEQEDE